MTEADRAGVPRQMQAGAILSRQSADPARPAGDAPRRAWDQPRPPVQAAAPASDTRAVEDTRRQAEARVRQAEAEAAMTRRRLEQEEARAGTLSEAAASAGRELAAARAEVEALRARAAQDHGGAEARALLATADEARRVAEDAAETRRQALTEERARSEQLATALAEARRRVAVLENAAEAAQVALQAQAASAARERAMMRAGLRRLAVALRAAQVARSEANARAVEFAGERDRAEQGRLAAERSGAETRGRLDRLRDSLDHAAEARARDTRGAAPSLVLQARPGTAKAAPEAFDEDRLLARVAVLLRRGDISGARLFLTLGVRSGSARATALLAETYDPDRLAALQVRGMRGDPDTASALYRQAQENRDLAGGAVAETPRAAAPKTPTVWSHPIRQAGLPMPVLTPVKDPPLAPFVPPLSAPWGGE